MAGPNPDSHSVPLAEAAVAGTSMWGARRKPHFLNVSRALQAAAKYTLHEQYPLDGTCGTEKTKVSTCTAHSFAVVIVKPF